MEFSLAAFLTQRGKPYFIQNERYSMDIIQALQEELQIGRGQVEAAVKLIDEGNTIPFIARYRKEATGSLNDEVLRELDERLRYLRNLEEKKTQVIATIQEQQKLTPELEKQILEAKTLVAVEAVSYTHLHCIFFPGKRW